MGKDPVGKTLNLGWMKRIGEVGGICFFVYLVYRVALYLKPKLTVALAKVAPVSVVSSAETSI